MSKSSKAGLKPSIKKQVRPGNSRAKTEVDWIDVLDAVNDRLNKIATLAGLLSASTEPDSLDPKIAADTGSYIEEELRQTKALLSKLEKAG